MISHITVGTNRFEEAVAFYRPLMSLLGYAERVFDPVAAMAAWESAPNMRPLFILTRPWDQQPARAGNGQLIALQASSRRCVDHAYALALCAGARDEGAPGLRPHYHAHYYGAYFRDLDGNKLCVVCHTPPV